MERLNAVLNWIDARFPLTATWKAHLSEYYAPKNLNFWYNFGSLALLILAMQLVTGILLTMHYKPDAARAFSSVEYIMRDVPWGWLIRYMHSTGASMFFVVIYLHMFRSLIYGSYRKPRELVWLLGMLIYLCLMAEAFFGYLLPWGGSRQERFRSDQIDSIEAFGETSVNWCQQLMGLACSTLLMQQAGEAGCTSQLP
jgi:ubiquinol-cytochrome c reductase cytochrome b subunit